MNELDRLVGQEVTDSEIGHGVVSLTLSDGAFAAYNPVGGASPESLKGARIASVELVEHDRLSLVFADGAVFHVSLRDEDYSGPEAFVARLADGEIIVGQ